MLSDGDRLYVPGVGQWDGAEWVYSLPDGLGSVRQLADAGGHVVQRYDYSPFGRVLAAEGGRANPLQYTGQHWDGNAGLLYLRARWYDPATGRFLTRDPFPGFAALPQTQHPYVYVGNNPINLTDPSGEFAFIPLLLVGAAGGALGGLGYYAIRTALNPCVDWDWGEAIFWGGVGTGIGAILGSGIYGGWWIGVQFGWWGAAAGGGMATQQAVQQVSGVWQLPPWQRGDIIHQWLGENLPHNFPKIDRFVNGVATSIKSIDLRTATYQNINTLANTVRGYINTMASYQGQLTMWGNKIIYSHQITSRAVDLAIPTNGVTPAQLTALQQMQQYASSVGVTLNIIPIP